MRKTLITGATGGLGSAVAQFLKSKNETENIAVLVRNDKNDKAIEYKNQGFDVRVADYDKPGTLISVFTGIEVLYFVSGSDINTRFNQHKNVVAAAIKAGIKHIIYTSTVRKDETIEAPLHLVVSAHAGTEELIKESGIPYTILRHSLYGEVIPMFIGDKAKVLESKLIYLPTGNGKTAFVPRIDFAEAAALILKNAKTHENKIYEFNGSEAVTLTEIAKILSGILGESINYVSPGKEEFEATLASFGLPEGIISLVSSFGRGIANGEFDHLKTDIETILGRKTQSMEEYLQEVYK
jgi:NAD(P)H dehydrogenase (quinone)